MWRLKEHRLGRLNETTPPCEHLNGPGEALLFAECRHLIHQIRSAQHELNIRSILLISQLPGEGKTILTSILAEASAKLFGDRVLIVDTASSSSTDSYARYHLNSSEVTGPEIRERAPRQIMVVAAKGPPWSMPPDTKEAEVGSNAQPYPARAPSEFEVGAYLNQNRNSYDLILIDSCALRPLDGQTLHPAILASFSDAVIVVLSPASVERKRLAWMKGALSQHQIKPLGFVFNQGGQA